MTEKNSSGRPGGLSSATEPQASRPSRASIPDAATRLKLDLRIHAQRREIRGLWDLIEGRRLGHHRWTLEVMHRAKRICDLLGIPEKAGLGTTPLLHRMHLAAQAIEARRAATTGAVEDESAVRKDAPGETKEPQP